MRDLPPESLIARLIELRLCTAADVQRAHGRVRRMTRDLPAFDSVWIDALTQLGTLTPFQARWLEVAPPESLRAGDYFLREGLGAGIASDTFLATRPDRRRPVVLKRLSLPAEQAAAVITRLEHLLERCHAIHSPHVAVPVELIRTPEILFLVSPQIPGLNLAELLIRRGRFPARMAAAVAEQLLLALAVLHAAGLAHGDLRLTKLRLTDRGQIVLVDGGLRPALTPELLVHAVQSSAEADVIAPERIGTNHAATAASDLYAAGCVLWQLLTGRPPYPQADPLTKLAAHQTRRIEDVRELAPETPAKLAELILQLTAPNPQDRPQSAEAALRRIGSRGSARSGALARFRRQFDVTVPHLATRSAAGPARWSGISAAVLVLGLAVVVFSDRGLQTELLDIAQRTLTPATDPPHPHDSAADVPRSEGQLAEIPPPDARGVITLTDAGPYAARELTAVGPMIIQATQTVRPVIRVVGKPWSISAQQVVLKNVQVECPGTGSPSEFESFVQLTTQRFQISGCRFLRRMDSTLPADTFPSSLSAVTWEPLDPRDPQAGRLEIEHTLFQGDMHGLKCLAAPLQITWRNVLKTDSGSAVVIEQAQSPRGLTLVLDHVTLRQSGALLACSGPLTERASAAGIDIEARNCVFDILSSLSLVELQGPKVREDWSQAIRLLGDGSIVPPNITLLAAVNDQDGVRSALESDDLPFEGLFLDDFEFAGSLSDNPRDSVVVKTQAPRRQADEMPGAAADRLVGPE